MGETKVAIEQIFVEISRLHALIRQEQAGIDRLKAESKIITDHTDAVLSRLRVQLDTLERSLTDIIHARPRGIGGVEGR